MRHGSLFSGIGGFDLAAEWMGWENVFQVEWDSYCQKVLTKNFPDVKRYGDIREFDGKEYRGRIDIVSGGFPCQPFSDAGKRKGTADDRYLWPEMLRVIREIESTFVVGENVAGLISMENGKTLDRILSDLANDGYTTEQFVIPACSIGAYHQRDRIWIIGYKNGGGVFEKTYSDRYGNRLQRDLSESQTRRYLDGCITPAAWENNTFAPPICRTTDGIPNRVDRIKALGNAIVPSVAYEIFKAIEVLTKT